MSCNPVFTKDKTSFLRNSGKIEIQSNLYDTYLRKTSTTTPFGTTGIDYQDANNIVKTTLLQGTAQQKTIEKTTRKKVEYEPEFLTSVQAGRTYARRPESSRGAAPQKENNMLDASAAAIILQSYLDRTRN